MARVKGKSPSDANTPMRPSLTPEAQENRMIALSMNLVEQRLLDGTASSQETTHFLKLATVKSRLEQEKLIAENELLKAKAKAIEDEKTSKVDYEKVLKALREYSGQGDPDDDQDLF